MTREEDIKKAVETMRKGGVILYPTDTVWGIGCDATNAEAVKRVYEIKQRDDSKALICLVDSDARMQRYFRNVPDVAWQLVDSLKEGDGKPTTLILDGAINLADNLIAEDGSVGVSRTSLSRKNSVSDSRRPSSLPLPISVASLPHRITAILIPELLRLLIMCVGVVVRSISLIHLRASSN